MKPQYKFLSKMLLFKGRTLWCGLLALVLILGGSCKNNLVENNIFIGNQGFEPETP